jgi:hypothetical protein
MHVVATAARERTEIETVAEEARQSCGEARVLPIVADVTQEHDCAAVAAPVPSSAAPGTSRRSEVPNQASSIGISSCIGNEHSQRVSWV